MVLLFYRVLPVRRTDSHVRLPGVHDEAAGDLHSLQAHRATLRGPGLLQVKAVQVALLCGGYRQYSQCWGGGGTGTASAVVQRVGKITERLTVSETFKINATILSDTKLH